MNLDFLDPNDRCFNVRWNSYQMQPLLYTLEQRIANSISPSKRLFAAYTLLTILRDRPGCASPNGVVDRIYNQHPCLEWISDERDILIIYVQQIAAHLQSGDPTWIQDL